MGAFMIWLSGASPRILKRCPTERPKYLGIGNVMLVTAALGAVSVGVALHLAVGMSLSMSILVAIVWGLAIISLDRWLTVSLVRLENPWRYLILIIPRLILAALIGLIVSTPIVLQLFHSDIDNRISIMHEQALAAFTRSLSTNPLTLAAQEDQARVTALDSIINSGGGPGININQDPTLQTLQTQYRNAENQVDAAFERYHCDLYGCQGTPAGDGPLATVDHQTYQEDLATAEQISKEITSREHQLEAESVTTQAAELATARSQLPAAKQALSAAQVQLNSQIKSVHAGTTADNGLLIQIQALDALGGTPALGIVRILLFALFTVLQCLPAVVKVLLNLGPPNTYDKMLALEEEMLLRVAREDALRRQAVRSLD
jgi:hypothetical protein